MKGYQFIIWLETLGGENIERRRPIIHARNLKEAWKKFEDTNKLAEREWVYKVNCLGTVKKRVEIKWEYTPLKNHHYESRY